MLDGTTTLYKILPILLPQNYYLGHCPARFNFPLIFVPTLAKFCTLEILAHKDVSFCMKNHIQAVTNTVSTTTGKGPEMQYSWSSTGSSYVSFRQKNPKGQNMKARLTDLKAPRIVGCLEGDHL